jgi:transcriptional regulator with XRE-family HTH domain
VPGTFRHLTATTASRVGPVLREWRRRRRLSQLELALEAGVSTRHLSYVETGRSRPSAEMVLHLAEALDVPLRERNALLLAAGHAPRYTDHDLDAPEHGPTRAALDALLTGLEPNPAIVVDRHWGLVGGNAGLALLTAGVAPELLEPPANVLRIALHPDGLAPRIANLGQWRTHLLERLGRQAVASGDPALAALHDELVALPGRDVADEGPYGLVAVPLELHAPDGGAPLRFISTVTTFGTAADVTLAELAVETFLPLDERTAAALRGA